MISPKSVTLGAVWRLDCKRADWKERDRYALTNPGEW